MFKNSEADDLEISPADVMALLEAPASAGQPFLVDVREEWELGRGVLPGAHHRPLSTFLASPYEWPAGDRPLIIYCEHGVRSLDVAVWLRQNKQVSARSMNGGFAEWAGPVESKPAPEDE